MRYLCGMIFTARTEDDLQPVAACLAELTVQHRVFAFSGQLGAGKTTLIKKLCTLLGVAENVSSPTFSLVNEYRGAKGAVYHFDFYRLKTPSEAYDIGFEEYLYSGHVCLIEWPEMAEGLFPLSFITINITVLENGERRVEINEG